MVKAALLVSLTGVIFLLLFGTTVLVSHWLMRNPQGDSTQAQRERWLRWLAPRVVVLSAAAGLVAFVLWLAR